MILLSFRINYYPDNYLDILCDMKSRGIEIVFAGGIPTLADGLESAAPREFARLCKCIQFTDESLQRSRLINRLKFSTDRAVL